MKKYISTPFSALLILSLSLLWALSEVQPSAKASSAFTAKYDFDRIEVINALEFDALPERVEAGSWIYELSGGPGKPIRVMYGTVNMYTGNIVTEEEFIKVSGENGSERFLSNSRSYWDNGTRILFWSGKKLEGNSVVKDYTKPMLKAVVMNIDFGPNQTYSNINLEFTESAKGEISDRYYKKDAFESVFTCNMDTLISAGEYKKAKKDQITDAAPSDTGKEIPGEAITGVKVVDEEKILYEFDEIEPIYNIELGLIYSANSKSWLDELTAKENTSLRITHGEMLMKMGGSKVGMEQFLEVSGEKGSRRFLSKIQKQETVEDKKVLKSLFWEGTRIVKNGIVRTGSVNPQKAVIMVMELDGTGKVTDVKLSFTEGSESYIMTELLESAAYLNTISGNLQSLSLTGKISTDSASNDKPQDSNQPEMPDEDSKSSTTELQPLD